LFGLYFWLKALTILGNVHEVEGEERKRLSGLYLARHPHLTEFLQDPNCALMILEVERYIMVIRFQQVNEISFKIKLILPTQGVPKSLRYAPPH